MPPRSQRASRETNRRIRNRRKRTTKQARELESMEQSLTSGSLNPTTPPTALKTRANGPIKNGKFLESGTARAFVWDDNDGRKVLLQRKGQGEALPLNLDDMLEAVMNLDDVLDNELPAKIFIEMGPNDTRENLTDTLKQVDPGIQNLLQFSQGGANTLPFQKMRDTLERQSNDRKTNPAYLQLLAQLEQLIELENRAKTPENTDAMIDLTDQLLRSLDSNAASSRNRARNQALNRLKGDLRLQRNQLEDQFTEQISRVKRTPMEVMVHLLREVERNMDSSNMLTMVTSLLKEKILTRDIGLVQSRKLLDQLRSDFRNNGYGKLANTTEMLIGQLPDPSQGQRLEPSRLNDSIYGRVFDSSIMYTLVNQPPPEVMDQMFLAGREFASYIDRTSNTPQNIQAWQQTAVQLSEFIGRQDPRQWFPDTPGIRAIATAPTPQAKLAALKAYLNNPDRNGQGVISIPYLLVKASFTVNAFNRSLSPWMQVANAHYNYMNDNPHRQANTRVGRTTQLSAPGTGQSRPFLVLGKSNPTEGTGITLRHQPNPFVSPTQTQAVRPTTKNIPQMTRLEPVQGTSLLAAGTSVPENTLNNELPFASGVSGSTNIMANISAFLKQQNPLIDTRALMLGTMMFLVYDGGHSIHEALWVINSYNIMDAQNGLMIPQQGVVYRPLNLGINLGPTNVSPDLFTSNYQTFLKAFEGTATHMSLKAAMDKAMSDTTSYFSQYSIYSSERAPGVLAPPALPGGPAAPALAPATTTTTTTTTS